MMWPRIIEFTLGLWLAASPFIFAFPADLPSVWWNAYICAFVVVVLSLASIWHRLGRIHFATTIVGGWLVGWGWANSMAVTAPWFHNDIVVGLLLIMLSIIPAPTTRPPAAWTDYERRATSSRSSDG